MNYEVKTKNMMIMCIEVILSSSISKINNT